MSHSPDDTLDDEFEYKLLVRIPLSLAAIVADQLKGHPKTFYMGAEIEQTEEELSKPVFSIGEYLHDCRIKTFTHRTANYFDITQDLVKIRREKEERSDGQFLTYEIVKIKEETNDLEATD